MRRTSYELPDYSALTKKTRSDERKRMSAFWLLMVSPAVLWVTYYGFQALDAYIQYQTGY